MGNGSVRRRKVVKIFNEHNYYSARFKGDHEIFKHLSGKHLTLPVKTDVNRMLVRRLVKSLGDDRYKTF